MLLLTQRMNEMFILGHVTDVTDCSRLFYRLCKMCNDGIQMHLFIAWKVFFNVFVYHIDFRFVDF